MGAFRNTNAGLITVPVQARYSPYLILAAEHISETGAAVMSNGLDVFTIANGPIVIYDLVSICITANDATASTLQWRADGTVGAATTFSGATASLASAAAGTLIATQFTALTTAPVLNVEGVGLSRAATTAAGVVVPAGIIEMVVGVGSTTGTWKHYMRYWPLSDAAVVTPAF